LQTPEQILKQYWGYDAFRPLQREIIQSVLDGHDTLALLPTGGGKSLCYQVPALANGGLGLVISPLIALMQDQVARLKALDIPAACIYSGMNYADVKRTLDNTLHGGYKLLYVSPERLQTRLFREYMGEFDVSLVAVDEAHCISQWGHDFRPSYLQIADIRAIFPSAPVLALTASATGDVQEDIAIQMKMRRPVLFRQSFSRRNIYYDVRYTENKSGDTLNAVAGRSESNNISLPNTQFPISTALTSAQCSIIYCRSRKQTETVATHLEQAGIAAVAYHAGLPRQKREETQEMWMKDKAHVMVATTAFGMGIDKPHVRAVLHYDAPEHLEAWYQEAGRAGRDGGKAHALTLYNSTDIKRLREAVDLQYPPEAYLRQVYQSVAEYLQIPIGAEPDHYYPFDIFDFCSKFDLKSREAIPALKLLEQEELWSLSEAVYNPATIQFTVDRHALDGLERAHPNLYYVAVGLLRMYNTIFHFPTPVRELAIAKQLRMLRDDVIHSIELLHRMGILLYNRPGEGPQLFFHHYRVDSRHLIIDLNRIAILRRRAEVRTDAMIAFLQNTTECRERLFLAYFGEEPEQDCGHCDVCRRKQAKPATHKDLRRSVIEVVSERELTIQQLIAGYPAEMIGPALAVVRAMVDEGALKLNNGVLSKT